MNGYIVYLLEPYNETSIKKRMTKRPKSIFRTLVLLHILQELILLQ